MPGNMHGDMKAAEKHMQRQLLTVRSSVTALKAGHEPSVTALKAGHEPSTTQVKYWRLHLWLLTEHPQLSNQ